MAEDVKSIPMPRDTPPPIPKDVMDRWWAKRRAKRNTNANTQPLGRDRGIGGEDRDQEREPASAPVPVAEAKTVYEAKPIVRDLRKEAVAFVPSVVRTKLDKGQGKGGLIEPEEADRLEEEGYMRTLSGSHATHEESTEMDAVSASVSRNVTLEEVDDED